MEEIQLATAHAYFTMVIGIGFVQNDTLSGMDKLQQTLSLLDFDEDPIGYAPMHKKLLQEIIDNGGLVFIEDVLAGVKDNPSHYDPSLIKHFQELQENIDSQEGMLGIEKRYLLAQIRQECENNIEIEYDNVMKKSKEFLLQHHVLPKIIPYKLNEKRLDEEIVSTQIYKIGEELTEEYKILLQMTL